jgi:hypothetical protein
VYVVIEHTLTGTTAGTLRDLLILTVNTLAPTSEEWLITVHVEAEMVSFLAN